MMETRWMIAYWLGGTCVVRDKTKRKFFLKKLKKKLNFSFTFSYKFSSPICGLVVAVWNILLFLFSFWIFFFSSVQICVKLFKKKKL